MRADKLLRFAGRIYERYGTVIFGRHGYVRVYGDVLRGGILEEWECLHGVSGRRHDDGMFVWRRDGLQYAVSGKNRDNRMLVDNRLATDRIQLFQCNGYGRHIRHLHVSCGCEHGIHRQCGWHKPVLHPKYIYVHF